MTIDEYIILHSDQEDKILVELSRETNLKVHQPRMLSGHIQGKFIEFFSKMIKPNNILEIGTYTGYSAICLAKGLAQDGLLQTIEINDERETIINKYITKAGLNKKIQVLFGDALEIIPTLNTNFEIVFIDADKPNYLNYYKLIFDKLKPGAYIIADNVLWNGKVIDKDFEDDESTSGIINFNKFVQNDKRVENFLLPIRDGLMIIRKK